MKISSKTKIRKYKSKNNKIIILKNEISSSKKNISTKKRKNKNNKKIIYHDEINDDDKFYKTSSNFKNEIDLDLNRHSINKNSDSINNSASKLLKINKSNENFDKKVNITDGNIIENKKYLSNGNNRNNILENIKDVEAEPKFYKLLPKHSRNISSDLELIPENPRTRNSTNFYNMNDNCISNTENNISLKTDNKFNKSSKKQNNSLLRRRISLLVKEIDSAKKGKISPDYSNLKLYNSLNHTNYVNKTHELSPIGAKTSKNLLGKNKVIGLLHKKEESAMIKLFSSKVGKILTENAISKYIKRPTSNIEMNELLINSFGVLDQSEYSKKIYNLSETYFNILDRMREKKSELEIAKFEQEKKKYDNCYNSQYETNFANRKIQEDYKWEKKFILQHYNNKLSEKDFINFKKLYNLKQKKEIIKSSEKLADLLLKMDANEYEKPLKESNTFKSTGNKVSKVNINRIKRLKQIMKSLEDNEQVGVFVVNVDKLKKEQKKSETDIMLAIKRSGKPSFVKTKFRSKTIKRYKGVSGKNFGVPA